VPVEDGRNFVFALDETATVFGVVAFGEPIRVFAVGGMAFATDTLAPGHINNPVEFLESSGRGRREWRGLLCCGGILRLVELVPSFGLLIFEAGFAVPFLPGEIGAAAAIEAVLQAGEFLRDFAQSFPAFVVVGQVV